MRNCRLVEEHGEGSWSSISKSFPGRIGKQCRERWHNQLRPDIRRDAWTNEEETLLAAAHARLGNKWADISKVCGTHCTTPQVPAEQFGACLLGSHQL